VSLGNPSKFQRVSHLRFIYCTDIAQRRSTILCTVFGRLLCYSTLYTHFGGSWPLTGFFQVQNSLCVQVLALSYIGSITAWHRAVGVSQTLRRGTRNAIKELSQRAPPIFGRSAITLGIGPHSSLVLGFRVRVRVSLV